MNKIETDNTNVFLFLFQIAKVASVDPNFLSSVQQN